MTKTTFSIGDTTTITHHDEPLTGRIVGLEPSRNRRGFPRQGLVLLVQPASGEAVEVHEQQSSANLQSSDARTEELGK